MTDHAETPDYEFPPRRAAPTKSKWHIWKIQNRWLRAAVAWPIAIVAVLIIGSILAAMAVVSTVGGAARKVREDFTDFTDGGEWLTIGRSAWGAMTGKDEPA